MSETHGKVVANIQKQLESGKVWKNTSIGNPCDKILKLLLNMQKNAWWSMDVRFSGDFAWFSMIKTIYKVKIWTWVPFQAKQKPHK